MRANTTINVIRNLPKPVLKDSCCMELFCVVCSHLKVPAVYPDGCLRQRQVTDKAEIQRPDAWVLSNRESSECTVKCLPTSCDLALTHKELAVIKP